MASPHDLLKYLDDNKIVYRIITHPPAFTTVDHAQMTNISERYIVSTQLMRIGNQFYMTVLPADYQIQLDILSSLFMGQTVREASEEELNFYFPSCLPMAVPPFGNLYGLPVLVDASFQDGDRIAFNACSPMKTIEMRWNDYERLVHPTVMEFFTRRAADSIHTSIPEEYAVC